MRWINTNINQKTERMLELMESGAYNRAAAIADEIDLEARAQKCSDVVKRQ